MQNVGFGGAMVVTLIGYRGCGKSSVGPILAQLLGFDCADSDRQIELNCNKTIAEIFAEDGEAGFRKVETQALNRLLAKNNLVLAAGGGAVLANANRELMRAAGPVVWLQASCEELARRIGGDQNSGTQRPSLTGKSIVDEVAEVLSIRTPIYSAAATLTVTTEDKSPVEIAEEIFAKVRDSAEGASA